MRTLGVFALTAAMAAGFALPVQGQVMGGPRVGVSISNLSGDDITNTDSKTGMIVGWAFEFNRGPRLGFQPEFHYWEKGATSSILGVVTELDVSYLEVPLLLRVNLTEGSNITPRLVVGPTVGINLTCTATVSVGPFSGERDCADNEDLGGIKTLDLGATGGLGVAVDMGGWNLTADGRYTFGLTDIIDDVNIRNRGFGLMVGVGFPLTR